WSGVTQQTFRLSQRSTTRPLNFPALLILYNHYAFRCIQMAETVHGNAELIAFEGDVAAPDTQIWTLLHRRALFKQLHINDQGGLRWKGDVQRAVFFEVHTLLPDCFIYRVIAIFINADA